MSDFPPPIIRNFKASDRILILRSLTTAGFGVAAKVLGLVNQIASIALISSTLGADGLQEQILAIAFVGWFNLTQWGMYTSLPVLLIRSSSRADSFATIVKTAFLIAAVGCLCALGLTLLIIDRGWLGGPATAPIAMAAVCNAVTIVLGISERVFQAIDRIAQFNILNMSGTLVSLAATFYFSRMQGTTSDFVLAYYVSMMLPALIATLAILPRMKLAARVSLHDLISSSRRLVGVGIFGYGYEIAAYCKIQAPLTLLSALHLSNEIAPVGIGLRVVALVSGSLSIVIPILFLRIGQASQLQDQEARRLWTYLGIACSIAVAIAIAGLFLLFGQPVYQTWTGGAVKLDQSDQVALAAFSALYLAQNLLYPLAAPHPAIAGKLRWMFWLEALAILAAGTGGALAVPAAYGGAGMLAGATLVLGLTVLILLVFLARSLKAEPSLDAKPS